MRKSRQSYDWAQALLSLANAKSHDLGELAKAANLDPKSDDLSDADLSGLDLSGQDLSGWNLKYAKLAKAKLTGTKLRDATMNINELIHALDWRAADLDDDIRAIANELSDIPFNPVLLMETSELRLTKRTRHLVENDNLVYVGDLVQRTEAEMLRTKGLGRRSLNEIKECMVQFGVHLGMEVPGWPPENIDRIAKLVKRSR